MWWRVELPLTEGEETLVLRYQFTLFEVEEQELQMPQLGASKAYPGPQESF
jgi:hypothetical protein